MRLTVLFVLLTLGSGQGQSLNNFIQTLATRNPQLDDIIFTSSLLFQTQTASIVTCLGKCLTKGQCASFTFTPPSSSSSSSSKGSCRGYSKVMTADDVTVVSLGSAFFIRGK